MSTYVFRGNKNTPTGLYLVPQATYHTTHTYSVVGKTLTTGCLHYPTHVRIWGLKEGINSKGETKRNYKYSIGSTYVRCLLPVQY